MLPEFFTCSNDFEEALETIKAKRIGRNCVWAVAHIYNHESNRGTYWATHSTENVLQVIGGAIEERLEKKVENNIILDRIEKIDRADRWKINEKIAEFAGRQSLAYSVGHAEELIIMAWDYMLNYHAIKFNGEIVNAVNLYISHSPCTIHDGKKRSDNIPGKPPSCLSKLDLLRSEKTAITRWAIWYGRPFGILEQKKQGKLSDLDWQTVKTGQALIYSNPIYKLFTPEISEIVKQAGL
jgi:hypothetical protein